MIYGDPKIHRVGVIITPGTIIKVRHTVCNGYDIGGIYIVCCV